MTYINQMKKGNLEEYPVEIRIRILASQLYAASDLGMWCFVEEGELFFSTCVQENEFLAFLKLGNCLDCIYQKKEGWDRPLILSDSLGLLWVAEHVYKKGTPVMLIIVGPVFTSKTSVKHIEDALRERFSSVHMCRQMMRTLSGVPVIAMSALNQYIKILHYTLTSDRIRTSDFIFQNEITKNLTQEEPEGMMKYQSMDRIMKGEKLILQAVTDGNRNYKEIVEREENYSSELISSTGDSLRDGKNSVLVFAALCTRTAIDGGLPIKTAKEMETQYVSEIEKSGTITQLKNVKNKMLDDFVCRVRESQENPLISKTTQESCDYIRANVLRPLTVEEIAQEMGYTTYYFTKKFYKEMGIKVTDYIKQARVEYAKIALLTTKRSIQDISDSLQFGTRNYFSKVFHDIVGMTPVAFREKVGKEGD